MNRIAVMGANPARQETLSFDSFSYGEVNRARKMSVCASGKGINFCRAAQSFRTAETILIQFAGGENAKFLHEALAQEKIVFYTVKTKNPTRTCITCLDEKAQVMTEVIEPSFPASEEECRQFAELFAAECRSASSAAICGSLPDGTDPELYRKAASAAKEAGIPLLLDAYRNVDDILRMGHVRLKINREELEKLTAVSGVAAGLRALFERYPILCAAITDGPGKAYASDGKTLVSYEIPKLEKVVNPIGCGDTASAVWQSSMGAGNDCFMAFRQALGAASANAETILPGQFSFDRAQELARLIRMTTEAI